ncbi:putative methyltransferase-domain-containing protein [Trichophaea hybrida]|nr:putative methyltransferase-domain-containing protein [Trichophaea hybrida]
MAEVSVQEAIHLFKCQYFQLIEPRIIEFPQPNILQQPEFQEALYESLFSPAASRHPPPERYTARVLKRLISLIEGSPSSPASEETPEINSDLLELYTTLLFSSSTDPTQKSSVTYTLPHPLEAVTILETPSLISGLGTTGLRTWEAALALGEYLLLRPPLSSTKVLELGAGTGLVSLVAARLGVRSILATDGDEGVCEGLRKNVGLNSLERMVRVEKRRWAGPRECPEVVDMVVGADVTYDAAAIPYLVAELVWLFTENPMVKVVISATIRNEETFEVFRKKCDEIGLGLSESVWVPPRPRVFWYSIGTEIRIVEVSVKK